MPRHALNDGENRGGSAAHVCAFIENAEHQYVSLCSFFVEWQGQEENHPRHASAVIIMQRGIYRFDFGKATNSSRSPSSH